ncbi:MAG: hypothetical protein RBU23_10135 [Candidatus Auribacterota bacterium]|jgi:hypothetical protein|nr:hypothetical protein [Candidatus Auribacterota bacterium]
MSIIINALTKSDEDNKNHKEHNLKHFFFKAPDTKHKHRFAFWLGLSFGCISMLAAGGLFFFITYNQQPVYEPVKKTSAVSEKPVNIVSPEPVEKALVMDDLDHSLDDVVLGPDIEEELELEALMKQRIAQLEAVDNPLPVKGYENGIPAMPLEKGVGLPEMIISGVIWDFSGRYVFIDGIPYQEQDRFNDILIEKITLSSIVVQYKDRTYEIILQ